jgi:predicted restriction endonuclease
MSQKQNHKRWRKQFNEDCLKRDNNKCVFCDVDTDLDVHHITDRSEMPNGGYVLSNGITLCSEHHLMAENFHMTGVIIDGFGPDDLYGVIGSAYEKAVLDSENLK